MLPWTNGRFPVGWNGYARKGRVHDVAAGTRIHRAAILIIEQIEIIDDEFRRSITITNNISAIADCLVRQGFAPNGVFVFAFPIGAGSRNPAFRSPSQAVLKNFAFGDWGILT